MTTSNLLKRTLAMFLTLILVLSTPLISLADAANDVDELVAVVQEITAEPVAAPQEAALAPVAAAVETPPEPEPEATPVEAAPAEAAPAEKVPAEKVPAEPSATVVGADPATADEATPATADEATPATANEADPATADEAAPATMDEADPATTGEADPATTGEADPATPGEADPATMSEATAGEAEEAAAHMVAITLHLYNEAGEEEGEAVLADFTCINEDPAHEGACSIAMAELMALYPDYDAWRVTAEDEAAQTDFAALTDGAYISLDPLKLQLDIRAAAVVMLTGAEAEEEETYTVTYLDEASNVLAFYEGAKYGELLEQYPAPNTTKAGYAFNVWYDEYYSFYEWNVGGHKVTGNMRIIGYWHKIYKDNESSVMYRDWNNTVILSYESANVGDSLTKYPAPSTDREGYKFIGWECDGTIVPVDKLSQIKVEEYGMYMDGVWKAIDDGEREDTHTITINITVRDDDGNVVSGPEPAEFICYRNDTDHDGECYVYMLDIARKYPQCSGSDHGELIVNNIILFEQGEALNLYLGQQKAMYTVKYVNEYGVDITNDWQSDFFNEGDRMPAAPYVHKSGYKGTWISTPAGYQEGRGTIKEDVVFTVSWEKKMHTVSFVDSEGVLLKSASVADGDLLTKHLPGASYTTRAGYKFLGWVRWGGDEPSFDFGDIGIWSDRTITGYWKKLVPDSTYDIYYVDQHSTPLLHYTGAKKGDTLGMYPAPSTARHGYDFEYWVVNADYDNEMKNVDDVKVTGDMMIVGSWDEIYSDRGHDSYYTIHFEDADGNKIREPERFNFTCEYTDHSGSCHVEMWKIMEKYPAYTRYRQADFQYEMSLRWSANFYLYEGEDIYLIEGTQDEKPVSYMVEYLNVDGSVLESYILYGEYNDVPRAPYVYKNSYTDKWTPSIDGYIPDESNVDTDLTFTLSWIPDVCPITYADENGNIIKSYYYARAGEDIMANYPPPTLEKEGYYFVGWRYRGLYNVVTDFTGMTVSNDFIYFAEWAPLAGSKCTIAYLDDAGNVMKTYPTATYGEALSKYKAPATKRTGHTFLGWTYGSVNTPTTDIASLLVKGDIVFTGHWAADTHTLTYLDDKGNTMFLASVTYGDTVADGGTPAADRVGYTFLGWTYAGVSKPVDTMALASVVIKKDIVFTGNWQANPHTVKYVDDAGNVMAAYDAHYGDLSNQYAAPATSRIGYVFKGWTTDASQSPTTDILLFTITQDVVFTGHWSEGEHTVMFKDDGGNVIDAFGVKYAQPMSGYAVPTADDTARDGYTFLGWTHTSVDTPALDIGAIKITKDTTFTGHWAANDHALRFIDDDGSEMAAYSAKHDDLVSGYVIPMTAKAGKLFAGWTFAGAVEPVTDIADMAITSDITFTGVWTQEEYVISYVDMLGMKLQPDTTALYGEPVSKYAQPSTAKENNTFLGWTYGSITTPTMNIGQLIIRADMTFTANWQAEKFTIAYVDHEGNVLQVYDQVATTGEKTALYPIESENIPTRHGYDFAGWTYLKVTKPTTKITGLTIKSDIIFTANWKARAYKLVYMDSLTSKIMKTYPKALFGERATKYAAPKTAKAGYIFLGWTSADQPEPTLDLSTHMIEGDTTFTANWEAIPYAITYLDHEGNELQSFTAKYGEKMSLYATATPQRDGYLFAGWTYLKVKKPTTKITGLTIKSDITFTANWKEKTFPLVYRDAITGKTMKSYKALYDQPVTKYAPPATAKANMRFLGWTYAGLGTPTLDLSGLAVDGALTLTGHWEQTSAYSVSYVDHEGNLLAAYDDALYGKKAGLYPAPATQGLSRPGYTFAGWTYLKVTKPTNKITNVVIKEDIVFTTGWKEDTHSLVYLDSITGKKMKTYKARYDQPVSKYKQPKTTKSGMTFLGWTYPGNSVPTLEIDDVLIKGDMIFTAHWAPIQYSIVYTDDAGNVLESYYEAALYGEKTASYAAPAATKTYRPGYTFAGWTYLKVKKPTTKITNVVIKEDITFVGSWKPLTYKVTFMNDAKKTLKTYPKVAYGQTLSEFALPSTYKVGYSFMGWTYAGVSSPIMNVSDVAITGTTVLTGVWEPINCHITYLDDAGNELAAYTSAKYGERTSLYPAPASVKEGYTFLGWTYGSVKKPSKNISKLVIKGDMTFTENWKAN